MIIILFLIPISILVAVGFLGAFIWAVRSGQYEDTCTPAMRILTDETAGTSNDSEENSKINNDPT
jgi:cbb3-type cytochrome oxidase maturation protein